MQRKRIPDKLAHDQNTTELAEVKIRASRCCCVALQKGHMTEQLLSKRNQRVSREIQQRKKVVDSLIYRKY